MTAPGGSGAAEFEEQRRRLFGLAYRMLGSAHDAEDVVQDAWLRWAGAERGAIEAVPAWLTTVVTRICLTRLTSARARRETYVGPWLPEPVATADRELGPLDSAEQRESVSMALLVTLERLTPAERAVYVLREAFGYGHREIAEVLELSEAHSRQLHRRARVHLADERRPAATPDRANLTRLVERFLGAAGGGDLPALESLLAADVTAWSDGGGMINTARRPVHGRAAVARYLLGVLRGRAATGVRASIAEVNGSPAVLGWVGERLVGVLVLDVADGRFSALRIQANPDKLTFLAARLSPTGEVRPASQPGLSHPGPLRGPTG